MSRKKLLSLSIAFDSKDKNRNLSSFQQIACGSVSAFFTRVIVQPLDVIKIRFQLQLQPIEKCSSGTYHGVLQAIRHIIRSEGLPALWKGHVPAQALAITNGAVQFYAYGVFTRASSHVVSAPYQKSFVNHLVCGTTAGAISTVCCQPLDVMRTRLAAQRRLKGYSGVTQGFRMLYSLEGVPGLFRGLVPSLLQNSPQIGLKFSLFALYESLLTNVFFSLSRAQSSCEKSVFSKRIPAFNSLDNGEDPNQNLRMTVFLIGLRSFLSGGLAGLTAKICVYPLDVAKKRIQVKRFQEVTRAELGNVYRHSSLLPCLRAMIVEEGIFGFYKGLLPSLIKSTVTTSCMFFFYSSLGNIIVNYYKQ